MSEEFPASYPLSCTEHLVSFNYLNQMSETKSQQRKASVLIGCKKTRLQRQCSPFQSTSKQKTSESSSRSSRRWKLASLIVEKLSKTFKLKGLTYHCMDSKDKVKKVSFNVLNSGTSRTFQVKTAYTMPRLQAQLDRVDWSSIKQKWSHLVDIQTIITGLTQVESDVLRVHDVLESRYPSAGIDAPDGIKTHFGWCTTGPVPTDLIKFNANVNSISIRRSTNNRPTSSRL